MKGLKKYLDDQRFIRWVFQPDTELDEWWRDYLATHHHELEKIQLARKILDNLRTEESDLSDHQKAVIFARALDRIEREGKPIQVRKMVVHFLRYAAVAIIFFSIGALLFYERNQFNPQFVHHKAAEPVLEEEARLIRPGGEQIRLDQKSSVIEHRQDGQILINNNKIDSSGSVNPVHPGMNQLVIPYGKTSELVLPDGTRVWLNAGSRLVYPEAFVDKTREVFLAGEAFFDVMHDEKKSFVVQTTDIRIRVLGTRFNVCAYPTEDVIETVLASGKLRLEQNMAGLFQETSEINPGEMGAFFKANREIQIREVDIDDYILWTTGFYKFERTDLSRVVKKLERYFNISFTYVDPFLGGIKISGKLELTGSRDEVLANLSRAGSIRIQKIDEKHFEILR